MNTADAVPERSEQSFDWPLFPETESFVDGLIESALDGSAFASDLARRMHIETSTRFADWVDHMVLTDRPGLARRISELGYSRAGVNYAADSPVFTHERGVFPRLALAPGSGSAVREIAIGVESAAA